MANLIEHMEKYCGRVVGGWNKDPEGKKIPYHIVRMENGIVNGVVSFSTLGLSKFPMKSTVSDKIIRHELLILVDEDDYPPTFRRFSNKSHQSPLHDSLLTSEEMLFGVMGGVAEGTQMAALYATLPTYFPDEFNTFITDSQKFIVFVWFIPITGAEASFVRVNGWNKFENLLVERDTNFLDFNRMSVV